MTKQDVLDLYGIKMVNRTSNVSGQDRVDKIFSGGQEMGDYFDLAFNNVDVIDRSILPIINHFLNGNNPPMDLNQYELGSGFPCYAMPYLDAVRFHNPHNGEIVQTIPLEHFKVIAEAWRDFLLEVPLRGPIPPNT